MMGIKPSCTCRRTSLGSVTPSIRLTAAYIAFALPPLLRSTCRFKAPTTPGRRKARRCLLTRHLILWDVEELDAGALPHGFQFTQVLAQPRRGLFCLLRCLRHNLLGHLGSDLGGDALCCLSHKLPCSFPAFS